MNKRIQIISIITIFCVLPVLILSAQSTTTGSSRRSSLIQLTITSNVPGAAVTIIGDQKDSKAVSGKTTFVTKQKKGNYKITVSAPNYTAETKTIYLARNLTVNFNLASVMYNLKVSCNVPNASVYIIEGTKGASFNGKTTFNTKLKKATYNVTVSAPNYLPQTKTVNMRSNLTLNFNLLPVEYHLKVTSNIPNAAVYIIEGAKGASVNGKTTFNTKLKAATYNVTVSAPNYFPQTKTVNLNSNLTLDFNLAPMTATVVIVIPTGIMNFTVKNPGGQIVIYDNGMKQKGGTLQLTPGQHTIRIVSGGFAIQKTINIQAGQTYTIEPYMGLSVNGEK